MATAEISASRRARVATGGIDAPATAGSRLRSFLHLGVANESTAPASASAAETTTHTTGESTGKPSRKWGSPGSVMFKTGKNTVTTSVGGTLAAWLAGVGYRIYTDGGVHLNNLSLIWDSGVHLAEIVWLPFAIAGAAYGFTAGLFCLKGPTPGNVLWETGKNGTLTLIGGAVAGAVFGVYKEAKAVGWHFNTLLPIGNSGLNWFEAFLIPSLAIGAAYGFIKGVLDY